MRFVNSKGHTIVNEEWVTFNDVLLMPQYSSFNSRNDDGISLSCSLGENHFFDIPIISSNMDTVTGKEMAIAMYKQGGLGILHRFHKSKEDYIQEILSVFTACEKVAISVGCGPEWISFTKEIASRFPENSNSLIVCLDVAHGHMQQSLDTVRELSKIKNIFIIAGNVATPEGACELASVGANCIKVGIGSGSVCTTRIVTGHGVPQLSAIINVRESLNRSGFKKISIIADGGLRNSGDMVKALAAGANAVMLGNLLAGCNESPGDIIYMQHQPYKLYRGQSSRHFLNDIGKIGVAAEGESIEIKVKGPVENIIKEFAGGIRSGFTYSGCGNISSLQDSAIFIKIGSHSWVEGTPHAFIKS